MFIFIPIFNDNFDVHSYKFNHLSFLLIDVALLFIFVAILIFNNLCSFACEEHHPVQQTNNNIESHTQRRPDSASLKA